MTYINGSRSLDMYRQSFTLTFKSYSALIGTVQTAGTDQVFRLNWAANGRQGIAGPSDYSLFVGDLTEEVTDYMLQEAFRRYYPSVRSAKVSACQGWSISEEATYCVPHGLSPNQGRLGGQGRGKANVGFILCPPLRRTSIPAESRKVLSFCCRS